MTVLTVYPSIDGSNYSTDADWNTCVAGAALVNNVASPEASTGQGMTYYRYQIGLIFDTSPIGATSTVTGVVFGMECSSASAPFGPSCSVVNIDPGAAFTTADWADAAAIAAATALASLFFTAAGPMVFTNAFGNGFKNYINKSGTTGFLVLSGGTSPPAEDRLASFYMSEEAGTTKDPYLTITYVPIASLVLSAIAAVAAPSVAGITVAQELQLSAITAISALTGVVSDNSIYIPVNAIAALSNVTALVRTPAVLVLSSIVALSRPTAILTPNPGTIEFADLSDIIILPDYQDFLGDVGG